MRVLILIPVMCRTCLAEVGGISSNAGINFNTRDVWACLAEVGRSISNSVGIIFNTRDVLGYSNEENRALQ